jgi:type II secretory pathway component GspD/PulD (secretin)
MMQAGTHHHQIKRAGIFSMFTAICLMACGAQTSAPSYELKQSVELKPSEKRCSFHTRTDTHALIRQVLAAYDLEASIDITVPQRQVSLQIDNVSLQQALEALELVTGTFAVPWEATQSHFYEDTLENRKRYEYLQMGTIRLLGMSAAEMNDIAGLMRSILETGSYTLQANTGSITIRAPQRELLPLDALLHELLNGRSVILLNVELYELDKTKTRNIGLTLPGSTNLFHVATEISQILSANADAVKQIVASGLADATDYEKIVAILVASGLVKDSVFNSPFVVFGGGLTESGLNIGDIAADLALNSSEARSLKQMQLRLLDQEQGTIRIGSRYPILISKTSDVGSSSSGSTVPQFQYQDLGITLKITPRINESERIALNLDLTVAALTGTGIGDLPILSNRQYTGEAVLRSGQSALLVSLLEKQASAALTGLPLSAEPHRNAEHDVVEIILMVTPHIVRMAHDKSAGTVFLLPIH